MGNGLTAPTQVELTSGQPHGQVVSKVKNVNVSKQISVLGLNVNSLPAKQKFGILEEFIHKFDIISLSETKTDQADELNTNVEGYTPEFMHRKTFKSKSGRIGTLFKKLFIQTCNQII